MERKSDGGMKGTGGRGGEWENGRGSEWLSKSMIGREIYL